MNPLRLLSLLATVAVRLSAVLYGSGTDAGWVRLYDAAAPAAISSAAKAHKHTANTHATRRDSPLTAGLPPSHSPSRARRLPGGFIRGSGGEKKRNAHDPHLLWMRFFLPRLSIRPEVKEGTQPWTPGLQDSRACCCCCTRICFFRICETSIDPRRVRGRGGRGGCSAGPDPHRPVGAMEPTSAWSWGRSVTEERTHSGLRCPPAPSRQVFKVVTVVMHERASWTEACLKPRSNNSLQQDTWCLLQKAFILSLCYYFNVFPDVMWLKTHRIQI